MPARTKVRPRDGTDIASVILSGTLEVNPNYEGAGNAILCTDLNGSLTKTLYNARHNIRLIPDYYFFNIAGPLYSKEVDNALFDLASSGFIKILSDGSKMVTSGVRLIAEDALERKVLSKYIYDKLKKLGKKVEGVRAIRI